MNVSRVAASLVLVCVLAIWNYAPSWAQAQSVTVPTEQRELTHILSKYNEQYDLAPNNIYYNKIRTEFWNEFCAKIPRGNIHGWFGDVETIEQQNDGIHLSLTVDTDDLLSGSLGIGLWLGNEEYRIGFDTTQPHSSTLISTGSPLYDVVINLRKGDMIEFGATVIPYVSPEVCSHNGNGNLYFALVIFTRIKRIGWGMHLQ